VSGRMVASLVFCFVVTLLRGVKARRSCNFASTRVLHVRALASHGRE